MTRSEQPGGGRLRDAWAVRDFRVLATAFLVTMLGGSVASLAITVLVYESTGSPLLASMTFAAMFLPYLISATLLSSLADRWPRRRLLVASNLVSASLVAVMALPQMPVALRLVLLALLGLVSPISAGANNTLVARVLPHEAYVPGRAVMRVIAQGAQVFGAAVGGLLLVVLAPSGVLLVDATCYVASAVLVAVLLRSGRTLDAVDVEESARRRGMLRDSVRGSREVLAVRALRRGLLLTWAVPIFVLAPEALGAPYVEQSGQPTSVVGAWYVALPLGNLLGALLGVWVLDDRQRRRLIRPLAIAGPLLLVPLALVDRFVVAWLLVLACGMTSAYGLGLDRYVLDATPEPLLGRMFTLLSGGIMTLQGLGFALWGALGELLPAATAIGVAGAAGALVAACLRLSRDSAPSRAPAEVSPQVGSV